ncbi:hypothetical protein E3T24_00915 [Cryobacterium sp. TmT2-59]|uniref:hypothetical protein n=1 Tax=Cryobacterium sp. TmT2-59 TaxID=1259264 RepID=UPI00106BDDE4|nr:hypothetical protein [Cryobacterium sp. TmT2-59]TFC89398.1 hypothetical protein E3T24_00915 [Cryobacterium sp. TmT2-59]
MGYFLAPTTSAALSLLGELDASAQTAPLDRVRAIRTLLRELDADPATLTGVRNALRGGSTWEEIAEAALLQTAAAKSRWSGTDDEIAARQAAGRKRAVRPSTVPTDLPGLSVSAAAAKLGVTVQAVYLKVSRGKLASRTIELPDGRSYKRVFLGGDDGANLDHAPTAEDNEPIYPADSSGRSTHHD